MKAFIIVSVLFSVMSGYAQERILIGTLYQGKPNEVKFVSSKKGRIVKISAANVIEWDEEDDIDEVSKVIPGLRIKKRVLIYKGQVIGKRRFVDNPTLSKSFNKNQAYVETVSERYCTDRFEGDCLSARTRYHVYLVIL